jgi:high-affinity iron transporter
MLASLIIVFREVLEAGLIVGVVLAATQGIARRGRWIAAGVAAGTAGAVLLACFAGALSDLLEGNGQELFTATVLAVAVVMLAWQNLWMASHGREMARQLHAMGKAVAMGHKSLLAMAVVVAIAVLREGAEVVLFLYGVAASTQTGAAALFTGGALGVCGGALVSWLLYRGLVAIPLRHLFSVTSWLIALLAAGMAGQAAAILADADLIPSWGGQLWDTSWILPEASLPGRTLHVLVGYSERPMGIQLAAYLAVLATLVLASWLMRHAHSAPQPVAAPQEH